MGYYLILVALAVLFFYVASKRGKVSVESRHDDAPIEPDLEATAAYPAEPSRSFVEDPILEQSTYLSPFEKEEQSKFSRPVIEPLNTSLFERDKRDDLTRPIGDDERQRSLSIFGFNAQSDFLDEPKDS